MEFEISISSWPKHRFPWYPWMKSKPTGRALLFGNTGRGAVAPGSILVTAFRTPWHMPATNRSCSKEPTFRRLMLSATQPVVSNCRFTSDDAAIERLTRTRLPSSCTAPAPPAKTAHVLGGPHPHVSDTGGSCASADFLGFRWFRRAERSPPPAASPKDFLTASSSAASATFLALSC